jgi:hypothetical protein
MRTLACAGYSSSPIPLKSLSSAGFAKRVWQNLDVKELRYQNLENKSLGRGDSVSPDRHYLDHDRPIVMVGTRLEVTGGRGK